MEDGETHVSGDHTKDKLPPSENDYCVGLLIQFGSILYFTAGDLDGEYASSSFGYAYNDAETVSARTIRKAQRHGIITGGGIDALHVNHHGSAHSSNSLFLRRLRPQVSFISCGYDNAHGHPSQETLDRLFEARTDVFLTNICALDRRYGDAVLVDGDVVLSSEDGKTFGVSGSEKVYTAKALL